MRTTDVISKKISDHQPIIHNKILFWNVMMQGKMRKGRDGSVSYNNGFGRVESAEDYSERLKKVAFIIALNIYLDPDIESICLCEGPIQSSHINVLLTTLKQFPFMRRFFPELKNDFYTPLTEGFANWGLLMLTDKKYTVTSMLPLVQPQHQLFEKLANRLQLWKLTNGDKSKYLSLGHFPFAGDEQVTDQANLSEFGKGYCRLVSKLLKNYENEELVICADFNLNPYLISQWDERASDRIAHHNSILHKGSDPTSVTVDGILLSKLAKQKFAFGKFNPGLFRRLQKENHLALTAPLEFTRKSHILKK